MKRNHIAPIDVILIFIRVFTVLLSAEKIGGVSFKPQLMGRLPMFQKAVPAARSQAHQGMERVKRTHCILALASRTSALAANKWRIAQRKNNPVNQAEAVLENVWR